MRTGNQTWDALLGALVGVVRAEQKNAKTAETDGVLFEGFAALAEDDETALQNMLACAHAEKNRIAPDCAYCAMPCGSTSDLDFGTVRNAREAVRKQKFAITERLIEIAPEMLCKLESGELGENELFVFHKAVFALGEDWSPEELEEMLETLN